MYLQANRRGQGEVKCRRTIVQKQTKEDEKKAEIIDYITRVFLISQDKNLICAPYCFA